MENSNKRNQRKRTEIITGKILKRIYFSEETNYFVFKMKSPAYNNPVICVGYLPPHLQEVEEEMEVEVEGDWKTSKYGRQFQFQKICLAGEDEYSFFIRLVKGLGPKIVERIKERFSKAEIISVLEHSPERLLEVPGIGPHKLKQIVNSWQEAKKFRNLYSLFEEKGATDKVSINLVIKIYKFFEERKLDPVIAIKENPYQLTQIKGIGFKTADKIALSLGFSPESKQRIAAGMYYVLQKAADEEGHTFLEEEQFQESLLQELYSEEETYSFKEGAKKTLDLLIKYPPEDIVKDPEGRIGLKSLFFMEEYIRQKLSEKAKETFSYKKSFSEKKIAKYIEAYEENEGFLLTEEQRKFLFEVLSFRQKVFALTGYAGTGKTTVLKALLFFLLEIGFTPEDIVCCAFTGMAARRLKEVTGFPYCKTIHSLLEYGNGEGFKRNEAFPLDQRIVILDEASMVNVPLFFSLMRALRPDSLFIIVGDPAQLPPIGAGNVFSDLVFNNIIPGIKLTEIKRQSLNSAITLIANEIRTGTFPKNFIYQQWEDFAWTEIKGKNIWQAKKRGASEKEIAQIRKQNNQAIKENLILQVKTLIENGFNAWEVQVLSPMRIGILGTTILNEELRKLFNPPHPQKAEIEVRGQILRQKDKIINLENRDLPTMSLKSFLEGSDLIKPKRILNGQLGTVIDFLPDTKQVVVQMIDTEDYVVFFDWNDFGQKIDLAYCLTVHKSQGSQYPFVLIPLSTSHWHMLNNQWLYTAITRAYRFCSLMGEKSAFRRAATNTKSIKRQTWLSLST